MPGKRVKVPFKNRDAVAYAVETHQRETKHKLKDVLEVLDEEPVFDQQLLDYLSNKDYPVFDQADAHRIDYERLGGDVDTYLKPFYNGHYAPAGSFFLASRLKDAVTNWLAPKPLPYLD